MKLPALYLLLLVTGIVYAQDESAYQTSDEQKSTGLLDPSRLTVQNSISFGAMSSGSASSGLQSQSLYTTMMRYQFTAPVTLNLNFSLPIHSSFSSAQNLSTNNLQSLDYFKSMPFQMSLDWQPTDNTMFRLSIMKAPANNYFYNGAYGNWDPFYRYSERNEPAE
jgi:hypothetical protein